jgi:hypothetical protein
MLRPHRSRPTPQADILIARGTPCHRPRTEAELGRGWRRCPVVAELGRAPSIGWRPKLFDHLGHGLVRNFRDHAPSRLPSNRVPDMSEDTTRIGKADPEAYDTDIFAAAGVARRWRGNGHGYWCGPTCAASIPMACCGCRVSRHHVARHGRGDRPGGPSSQHAWRRVAERMETQSVYRDERLRLTAEGTRP